MRRHAIIGRFGPLDVSPVPVSANEVSTRLDLVGPDGRLDYGIGQALADAAALSIFPTEIGLDLLVLAAHVQAADTRISRTTESQDTWTREIRLVVPVSDPGRWTSTVPLLKRTLDFLTGDLWTVGFRSRPESFSRIVPPRQHGLATTPYDSLALFSGGLDSLIGAIDVLEAGKKLLLVSHAADGATSGAQSGCFDGLTRNYGLPNVGRLRVWMSFSKGLVADVGSEDTTRGRSFLFFALGIFAGTGLGQRFTLRVPENGLIAVNVPLDPLRLGSSSTRTTHPFYIGRWNELMDLLEIPARVENPFWNMTKGEMAAACSNQQLLKALVPQSLSCAAATKGRWQKRGIEHCGYCLPCLVRRAALARAWGAGNDPTVYGLPDLAAQPLDTRRAQGEQVRSFQLAIARLRGHPGLEKILIHKPGILADAEDRLDDLAGVYRRGLEEVGSLVESVQTKPL
jgi:hypothetical protein